MKQRFVWDMDISAFMAANIALADPHIVHIAMGRTATDIASGGERFAGRMERAQSIFSAVWQMEQRGRPEYIFPVIEHSKEEIWDLLREELRGLAWSCRRPAYVHDKPVACGKCGTCKDMFRADIPSRA